MEELRQKQSITGFKVSNYQVKKAKEIEKVKIVLEAEVQDVSAGSFDFGEFLKALWSHQAGDLDIGLSVFMDKRQG